VLNAGAAESLQPGATVSREQARNAIENLAKVKREKLDHLLDRLLDRVVAKLRVQNSEVKKLPGNVKQTLANIKTLANTKSAPDKPLSIDRETSRLMSWLEQLSRFQAQLAESGEDKSSQLFLIQRDIDKMVRTEQEREKERKRVDQEAEKRGSLSAEMAEIVKWAEEDRLPVVAPVLDRFRFRDINADLDPQTHRIVRDATVFADCVVRDKETARIVADYRFKENQIVTQSEFEEAVVALRKPLEEAAAKDRDESVKKSLVEQAETKQKQAEEATAATRPMEGRMVYSALTLLPGVKFTLPLLLLALTIWLAWRVVNLPTFGDFLIATEAELNKVSWTTRHRLWQDTVVVLATTFLLAAFLFVVDIAWAKILSWKPIGVLRASAQVEKPKDESSLKW